VYCGTKAATWITIETVNHGELAVLYCFAFLFIAARGSGRWSLDALARTRSSRS